MTGVQTCALPISEVLPDWLTEADVDVYAAAFEESGDIFDAATARRLHDAIYSAGGRQDPAEAYKAFRGRLPSADALLRKRGFTEPAH